MRQQKQEQKDITETNKLSLLNNNSSYFFKNSCYYYLKSDLI